MKKYVWLALLLPMTASAGWSDLATETEQKVQTDILEQIEINTANEELQVPYECGPESSATIEGKPLVGNSIKWSHLQYVNIDKIIYIQVRSGSPIKVEVYWSQGSAWTGLSYASNFALVSDAEACADALAKLIF